MRKARLADRGWFEPGEPVRDAYYGLAAAVVKQAARDVIGQDCGELRRLDAALWLLSDAPIWLDALGLGALEPAQFLARLSHTRRRERAARLLEADYER